MFWIFSGEAWNMMSSRPKKTGKSCPVCRSDLVDTVRAEQAENALDAELSKRVRDATKRQTEEYRRMLKEIRLRHQNEIRELRKSNLANQNQLKDRFTTATKKEKAASKTALARLRKVHQEQLRSLRDSYDRESLRVQKEQESTFNAQLQEIIRNYGSLASGHQKEQERLKKIHDESDTILRKRDSEIAKLRVELARSSSKLEIKELMLKLHERDDTIERLNSRIEELEGKVVVQPPQTPQKQPAKVLTDDEQKEKLKEYMRAIIEITRSQQADKKKPDFLPEREHVKHELPESKVDKKLGWFF
jgi:DNA repair exonuclease SbcCD ATPase subunit